MFISIVAAAGTGRHLAMLFAVCAVHELGHAAALSLSGGHLSGMTFFAAGIKMEQCRSDFLTLKREALVLLAGPAANIFLAAVLAASGETGMMMRYSLGAAVFNLMPYSALDGGSLVLLLCAYSHSSVTALRLIQLAMSAGLLIIVLSGHREALPAFVASLLYFAYK